MRWESEAAHHATQRKPRIIDRILQAPCDVLEAAGSCRKNGTMSVVLRLPQGAPAILPPGPLTASCSSLGTALPSHSLRAGTRKMNYANTRLVPKKRRSDIDTLGLSFRSNRAYG